MTAVWQRALALPEPNALHGKGHIDDESLLPALLAMRAEVDLTLAALSARSVPPELFQSKLLALRVALSSTSLVRTWGDVLGTLADAELHTVLGWAGVYLPDEPSVEEVDLKELTEEFAALQNAFASSRMPPAMQAYCEKQLDALRRAFSLYQIQGVDGLDRALEAAYGAAKRAQPAMAAEAKDAPAGAAFVGRVNAFIGRTMGVSDSVKRLHGGGASMLEMAEGLKNLIELAVKASS